MRLRAKLALSVVGAGLLTAALVIAAVLQGYQRFDRELSFSRATDFLERIVTLHDDLLEQHSRDPAAVSALLTSLLLYDPAANLYLLDAQGRVLAGTSPQVAPLTAVTLAPVLEAAAGRGAMVVMGDDPARGAAGRGNAVVAARAVQRATIRPPSGAGGYLYLVCPPQPASASLWAALKAGFALPALSLVGAILLLAIALSVWLIATVSRPLQRLTDAVAGVAPDGAALPSALTARGDEIGQLGQSFDRLLARVRAQWAALRRLDAFRREAVSNLSHDLRSPLTATAACLETLEARWSGDAAAQDRNADRELLAMARRNTRNAARLVQSLGDLAQLDEPAFQLSVQRVDLRELVDDVAMRFAAAASNAGIGLEAQTAAQPVPAVVDIELLERALANLVDNAIKYGRRGDRVRLEARAADGGQVEVEVADTGPGIAEADLPHLFERYYRAGAPGTEAPAMGAGAAAGKGLGLAIVARIAELHGGSADIRSVVGSGTKVVLAWPARGPASGVAGEAPTG